MPRTSTIAQADIARALRAFRRLGVEAEVRIYPDGMVIVCEKSRKASRKKMSGQVANLLTRTRRKSESRDENFPANNSLKGKVK